MKRLRAVGLDFLDTAPVRLEFEAELAAPATAVFGAISADPATWKSWFPGFSKGRYEGAPPYGVGTIREIRMSGSTYRETMLAWDEPTRWAYRVDACTGPLAEALVEDWQVVDRGGSTTVRWVFAIDPGLVFKVGRVAAEPLMGWLFRRAMRNLERRLDPASAQSRAV
jgi:hypothetical protein